jgi:hypothetical protein
MNAVVATRYCDAKAHTYAFHSGDYFLVQLTVETLLQIFVVCISALSRVVIAIL